MKKIIPIVIVLSTIFAMNKGIEYWKENAQPLTQDYQLTVKISEKNIDKPKKRLQKKNDALKSEPFIENAISYFTEQYMSLFEDPIVELTPVSSELAIEANDRANRMALACPVMPVPTIAFTNANASSTAPGCGISLTASGCGSNSVRWYRNGIYDGSGSTFTGYPSVNSNYSAECWDGSSCTSTQSNMIQVPVWQVRVTPQTSTTVCTGNSVTFTAEIYNASSTPFPSTATYQWQIYGGNIPSATNSTYNAAVSGYYSVLVRFPFPSACSSYGYGTQINVLPTTTISASSPTDVCPGNSVDMNWNYAYEYYQGAGTPTFQWKKDGVNINASGATSPYFKATQGPGAYTLTITKNDCSFTTTAINVTNSGSAPTQKPIITNAANSNTQLGTPVYACPSDGATFFASGCSQAQQAYWSDGTVGNSATFYSGNFPFEQKITVRCGASATCLGLASDTLILAKPKVEILKTVGPTICDGTLLTASSTPNSNVTFEWAESYNPISGATSNQYKPLNAGFYSLTATFSNLYGGGTCNTTSALTSTTSSPAVTTPIIKACSGVNPNVCTELVSPITLFSGSSVTLQASNCNATVTWSTGATGTSLVVSATGVYTATCSNVTCTSPNSNTIQVIINPCNTTVSLSHPTNDITNNPTINGTLWQASATNGVITASNWVTGNGTKATYQAKSILLSPGFVANTGTIFTASTGGCN